MESYGKKILVCMYCGSKRLKKADTEKDFVAYVCLDCGELNVFD